MQRNFGRGAHVSGSSDSREQITSSEATRADINTTLGWRHLSDRNNARLAVSGEATSLAAA